MPGMPVAKFGDLSIGIDMHPTVTPLSHHACASCRQVYDLMADLMAGMAAAMPPASPDGVAGVACNILKSMAPSVKVHNQWIAQAGHRHRASAGICIASGPVGQRYVRVGDVDGQFHCPGGRCALFLPHTSGTSCNIVGIPTIPRKESPRKVSKALLAPTSMLSTITSVGNPVFVGGPPTIDVFALAMKFGLKGLGKDVEEDIHLFQNLMTG